MHSLFGKWHRARRSIADLVHDCRGLAAIEFAFIVPLMIVMCFGTIEISSGIAVYRKVTMIARTLADLTTQSKSVVDSDLTNFFSASSYILAPYSSQPSFPAMSATVSELYIDPVTLKARVQWSRSATVTPPAIAGNPPTVVLGTGRAVSSTVVVPSQLIAAPGTYVIFSEASQLYKPAVGQVMSISGVTLSDTAYTRSRLSTCVLYNPPSSTTPCPVL